MEPAEAARELLRAEAQDGAIRRRTSGLMWMIWGIVGSATFMTYAFVEAEFAGRPWWSVLLWLPWTLVGISASLVLWRSARLAMRGHAPPRAEMASNLTIFAVVLVGGFTLVRWLGVPLAPSAVGLAAWGIASMVLGGAGILAVDAFERQAHFLSGALVLVAAIACMLAQVAGPILSLLAAVVVLVAYVGDGIVVALRG